MKRFFQFCSFAAVGSGVAYSYFNTPKKVFAMDDVAEGIQMNRDEHHLTKDDTRYRLFSVTPQKELAKEIAYHLNISLGKLQTKKKYPGSESRIDVLESVRSKVVYLICSFDQSRWSFNESLIDLLLTVCAMKKNSVRKVHVVLPYYAYTRQNNIEGDLRSKSVFASDIALMLEAAGADKIFTVDLEASQLHGSFNIPIIEIDCLGLCTSYFREYKMKDLVVVCANDRLFPRAIKIKDKFEKEGRPVEVGVMVRVDDTYKFDYIGKSVAGRDVLLIDNVIDTANTVTHVSKKLNDLGAKNIYMFGIHGVFSKGAIKRINESPIKEVVITNTIPMETSKLSSKINQISIANMLAQTIAQTTMSKDIKKDKVI